MGKPVHLIIAEKAAVVEVKTRKHRVNDPKCSELGFVCGINIWELAQDLPSLVPRPSSLTRIRPSLKIYMYSR